MARRALILVEGHRGIGLLFVQAALRLGLHSITLSADPSRYDDLAAEKLEAAIRVDTDNLDSLIRACSRIGATYDIAGFSGNSVCATVGKLCRHFNLPDRTQRPSNHTVTISFNDKSSLRPAFQFVLIAWQQIRPMLKARPRRSDRP